MSTVSLSLILLLVYIVTGYFIAKFRGAKRRIGFRWTLFFSILFSPIAGYFFTTLSPLRSRLPPYNPKDKWGDILLCIGGCIYTLYMAGTETEPLMILLSVIGPIGFVYYVATRNARNKKAYKQFVLDQNDTPKPSEIDAAGPLLSP